VRRFGGAVGAERADFPSVLGLAAPSRNSLRALRALRSDKRDESVYERASRWAASPARLGAPQARRTGPPHALGDELLVRGGLSADSFCHWPSGPRALHAGSLTRRPAGRLSRATAASASLTGPRAEGQDCLSPLQSVAAGAARWGRFGGAPRSAAAGAVRAAHFVNILIATVW